MEVFAQLVSDRPYFSKAAYMIGMVWGPWNFLQICRFMANGMGRVSLDRVGTVLRFGSRVHHLAGVWARAVGTEL